MVPAVIAGIIVAIIGSNTSLRTLYPVGSGGTADTSQPGTVTSLGIGVYLAAAGAAISFVGAFLAWREY